VHAAEKWALPGVRTVIESWGLIWGIDVTEPETLPAGTAPTAAEVLVRQERAELAARADVWRRELDRQEREERAGRVLYQPTAWEERAEAQAAEDRARARAYETAHERHEAYREGLRKAKAARPSSDLQAAMERFRAA
jgi:hypothetical protein